MRVVVTGGAGFIGSHIAEELINLGHDVVCVDNMASGTAKNIPNGVMIKHLDIAKGHDGDMWNAFSKAKVIFHNAASKCTVCREDPKRDLLVNAWGSWRVFNIANQIGAKVIHASTGSVYGKCYTQTEEGQYAPRSFYGVSKLAGEQYLRSFPLLRWVVLRYFHVFGERQNSSDLGGVIPIFITRLLDGKPLVVYGDGEQTRSFTYVKDVVRANMVAAEAPDMESRAYNVASGLKVSLNTLIDALVSLLNVKKPKIEYLPPRIGDIKNFNVDNVRMTAMLDRVYGLPSWTHFGTALTQTIDWYKTNMDNDKKSWGRVINNETPDFKVAC